MSIRGHKQFDKLANLHFITTTVIGFSKIFTEDNSWNDTYCGIIIDSLKFELSKHSACLIAYVIMPSHIHLIIYMPEGESISEFLRDMKKFTSHKIKKQLYKDRYYKFIKIFRDASKTSGFNVWMERFDDYIITSEHMLEVKMGYIHDNPRRAELVKEVTDWKYSSARNYYSDDNSIIEVGFQVTKY